MIGGGGGGAGDMRGGGGAGGLLHFTGYRGTIQYGTQYTITIGNGGGSQSGSNDGNDGNDTTAFGETAGGGKGGGVETEDGNSGSGDHINKRILVYFL